MFQNISCSFLYHTPLLGSLFLLEAMKPNLDGPTMLCSLSNICKAWIIILLVLKGQKTTWE